MVRTSVINAFQIGESAYKKEGTYTINDHNGTSKCHLLISTSLVEVQGEDKVLLTLDDITERKQAEEELRERTEELEIFNKAMVDREMRIIELKEKINGLCDELGKEPIIPQSGEVMVRPVRVYVNTLKQFCTG